MTACEISGDVRRASALLREGGLVAFATETVYGLGANAFDTTAAARIFEAKRRPHFDPLIVHVDTTAWLPRLVREVPPRAAELAERFWPGPLTLVLPKTENVPDLVTAGLPTVAIRIPQHDQALELLELAGVPVAAPSANLFGRISPTTAAHVAEQLGERIDFILDGGVCRVGVESTVLLVEGDSTILLRPGGLPVEDIERVIGPIELPPPGGHSSRVPTASPGMLPQHYAPQTPLDVVKDPLSRAVRGRVGLLAFSGLAQSSDYAAVEVLSESGDLVEAAAGFFAALRRLDGMGLDRIVAVPFPEQGLGRALNDRLRRAASRAGG